jgi:hypothetical protein
MTTETQQPAVGAQVDLPVRHEQERAAFEAWFDPGGMWPAALQRSGDGYKGAAAQAAWHAWKASAADTREQCAKLCERQDWPDSESDYLAGCEFAKRIRA